MRPGRDTRFVELGCYLCEVRAGQYWRLEHLANFDDFLARRKADYLMAIHEQLPKPIRQLMQACIEFPWPGNLRQLDNFAKRYLVLADEEAALRELRPGAPKSVSQFQVPSGPDSGLKSLARSVPSLRADTPSRRGSASKGTAV